MTTPLTTVTGPANLRLRLVTLDDAAYIHSLRTDPHYGAYLSPVTGGPAAQRDWIANYKREEAMGLQYYFVVETKSGQRCGLVRHYDITPESCVWGSWILDANKPAKAGLESAILNYDVAFDHLGVRRAIVDVMHGNLHSLAFHRRFGARETGADATKVYFEYTAEQFRHDRPEFVRILKGAA